MEYPELPESHIWRITEKGAEIWEQLPDHGPFENPLGFCSETSMDWTKYQYREVTLQEGRLSGISMVGRVTLYTDRKRRVYHREVDWSQPEQPYDALELVKIAWGRTQRVTYGFQGFEG